MVDITKQLCVKSWEVTAENGDYFKAKQGEIYTTSAPNELDEVMVFSNYWVEVPKSHFVPCEHGVMEGNG